MTISQLKKHAVSLISKPQIKIKMEIVKCKGKPKLVRWIWRSVPPKLDFQDQGGLGGTHQRTHKINGRSPAPPATPQGPNPSGTVCWMLRVVVPLHAVSCTSRVEKRCGVCRLACCGLNIPGVWTEIVEFLCMCSNQLGQDGAQTTLQYEAKVFSPKFFLCFS